MSGDGSEYLELGVWVDLGSRSKTPGCCWQGSSHKLWPPFPGWSLCLWAAVAGQTREADAEERSCPECPASHTLHPSLWLPFLRPGTPHRG